MQECLRCCCDTNEDEPRDNQWTAKNGSSHTRASLHPVVHYHLVHCLSFLAVILVAEGAHAYLVKSDEFRNSVRGSWEGRDRLRYYLLRSDQSMPSIFPAIRKQFLR